MTLRKRSEASGTRVPLSESEKIRRSGTYGLSEEDRAERQAIEAEAPLLPRTPEGDINNCAIANGESESTCQMCRASCPDRARFNPDRLALYGVGGIADTDLLRKMRGGPPLTDAEKDSIRARAARSLSEQEEQLAGERAFAAAAGAEVGQPVEVTWGEELFQPVQFNTFRVGPFKATTVVRPGETVAAALARLHAEIDEAAKKIRAQKVADYLAALRRVQGDGR